MENQFESGSQPASNGAPVQGGIPEKFQVTRPDGSMDIEASSVKLAEAHNYLLKRMGAGNARPLSPAGYQIAVPEGLAGEWNPAEDQMLQDFLGKAHKAGYSQEQIDFALDHYHANAMRILDGVPGLSEEQCAAELRKEWPSQREFEVRTTDALRAARAYFGNDADVLISKYGNDPALVKMLARLGGEMREDKSISTEVSYARPSVQSLISSEAYNNPKHPDHARVSRQVSEYYASINKG